MYVRMHVCMYIKLPLGGSHTMAKVTVMVAVRVMVMQCTGLATLKCNSSGRHLMVNNKKR